MADANANIRIDVDTSQALSEIKALQRQISIFHSSMAQSGKAAAAQSAKMQANLINSINAGSGFQASMTSIKSTTESFTNALEKNKLSMGQYFRYAGASTKSFGKLFKTEFNTIEKVARERVKDLQTQYIKMGRDANGAMKAIKVRPTTLDMQNLGTQTAIAAQKQQLFNQLMKQGSTNLLNFGKNTQWAGRQLMVGFTIPLTILGATASKTFMQLEEQAIRFKRVYGDMFTTDTEVRQALSDVRELAKEFTKFGVAVEDTIGLAASVAQMGAMGADLTNQVTQATRLAVLGGIEQQEALDTTISLTNAFGLATDQLAGKIAFLNAAENQTILSIEDFNEAIPKAGSVVKQLGGDVEDLAYFLTAMREGGVNASQSANALKSSLARLVNPTEVAKQKMAGFGIDILGIVEGNAGNLRQTIQVLAVELDKLDPLNKARAIEQLFGKFQFARMSTLFTNIVKEGSQANKILELTTASTEELAIIAERELGKVADSPAYKFKKAIEEFKTSLAPIGEAFLKLATPLIEFGNKVLDKFNSLSDGTKQFITGAVAIGGVVAPAVIMVIGLLANAVANTMKFALLLRGGFQKAQVGSDLLTDQLQYMNSEQIEAAAVAASLDQVHAKLRQTFTSEATAVNALTAAYERAIVKQNQMAASGAAFGGRGGKGPAPKKYNSGVVSVPGPKGAGDIVPAMLAPGEAVIPAEMARKYSPLIQSMISGNIPGYQKGISAVNFSHYGSSQKLTAAEAAQLGVGGATGSFLKDLSVAAPDADVRAIGSWGFDGDANLNRQAARSGADAESYIQDFKGRSSADRLAQGIGFGGGDLSDETMMKDFEAYDKDLQDRMIKARKDGAEKFVDTRDDLARIRKQEGKNFDPKKYGVLEDLEAEAAEAKLKGTKAGKVRDKARSRVRDIRWNTSKELNEQLEKTPEGRRVLDRITRKSGDKRGTLRGSVNKFTRRGENVQLPKSPEQERLRRGKAYNDGLAESAKTASESKRTKKIAKDTVDGYANELARGKKKVLANGKKQSQAQLIAEQKAEAKRAAARKGWETRRTNQELAAQQAMSAGARTGRLGRVAGGLRGMGGKLAMGGGALTSAAMMASMAPGKVGETAQKLMMPLMGLTMILPMLTSGIGIAVVALGAMAAAIWWAKSSFNKAQEESMALAESLGGGSKALEEFSKAAGNVSAGEIMDKRREGSMGVFQIQPGKNTFGNTFMGSDQGASMKESVKKSLATVGSAGTAKQVTQQLATAVASGALDAAQARSIIGALSAELGDYAFGIEVNATLTSLLGPNGENLAKDPLGIRLEILKDSRESLDSSMRSLGETAAFNLNDGLMRYGGAAAGAGAGAAAGAIAGGMLGSVIPVVGNIVGAGIGAVVGAIGGGITGGILGSKERNDRIAASSGASVAMQKIALQQQQEMSDSLELEYEQRIANAKAAGNLEEVERLTNQRLLDRKAILEQNQVLTEQIASQYSGASGDVQSALDSGVDKAMANQYKDTMYADVVPQTQEIIEQNVEDKEVQYLLKMQVASDQVNPVRMIEFLTAFEKGSVEQDAMINLIGNMGGAFTNQAMGVLGLLVDKDGNALEGIQSDVLLNISNAGSPQEANELLTFYQQLSQTDSVLEREAKFRFILANPQEAALLQKQLADISGFSGDLTLDVVANIINKDAVDALNRDLDYFNTLSNDMKKIYLQTLVTTIATVSPDDPALQGWLNAEGSSFKNSPPGTQIAEYANWNAGIVTKIAQDLTGVTGDPGAATTGSGSGPKASVLDDLTKKLRDVRLETIKAKIGWKASAKVLNDLFKGGKKSLDVFDGLSNTMRSLGAGEGMIEMIVGMDPDEFEKRKNELFNFDDKGRITSLTSKFKSFGAAINAVALGEYVNDQQSFIANTKNQFTAMNMLTAQGLSFVDAFKMVQNQALATAIAMSATTAEVEELIRINNMMNEMQGQFDRVSEEASAAESVKKTNEQFKERYLALSKLSKIKGEYSDVEIKAVLEDPNLTKLFLNPSIDPDTLKERLRQAEAQANLELRLKISTEEGKEALFDEEMGKIQDQFARKEQEIDIKFRLATEADDDIVREAQNKISAIQFEIDDYQAQLKGIGDQEEVINKKYDERFEALDKVGDANERIAAAQKAQLTVADALSRGDIAAAARAQQELQTQEAQASLEDQRKLLERKRDAELASLRSKSGLSRVQLEDKVKSKQDEIFNIQESELEPAEERMRIAEYEKAVQIDALEIAGRTRDEWDRIANAVDLATVNMEDFEASIERALALYEYFVNGKALDGSLFGEEELARLVEEGIPAVDIIPPEEITPEQVLGPDIVKKISEGADIDEAQLTERQVAAKNLYEAVNAMNDKNTAAQYTMEVAKKAGVIDSSGKMTMTADRAEAVMKDALKKEQQITSAEFARVVGTTNPDRLDSAYNRALGSQGVSTNVGTTVKPAVVKPAPAPAPQPVYKTPTPTKSYTPTSAPTPKPVVSVTKTSNGGSISSVTKGNSTVSIYEPPKSWSQQLGRTRAMGGLIKKMAVGGVVPSYFANGGSLGSDKIKAMLTPGEFVVRRPAVRSFGAENLEKINRGTYSGGSVYNYNLEVNVRSESNPDAIARTVLGKIKQVDSQRLRGNKF